MCVALWLFLFTRLLFLFVPLLFFRPFQMSSSEFHEKLKSKSLCNFRLGDRGHFRPRDTLTSAEGLRAWQLLIERYDPHIRSRTAGQLLSLLQFDFSGDMLAKLDAYERDLALYEQASGKKISDGLRVGIVLNRVTDTELATHLLLNSERFQTWALFLTRACGCLACKSSSSGSLPDASWSY